MFYIHLTFKPLPPPDKKNRITHPQLFKPRSTELPPSQSPTLLANTIDSPNWVDPVNRAIIEGCSSIDGPENLNRRIYIKTNIPAWGALIANIAAEADLSGCLSISLPIYYSGWNWFHSDVKLRTLAFIPELRWWPKAVAEGNSGLFFNIHAGIASFNVALGGEHRYQDHNRRSPAFGGGIGAGYRFRFCGNPRWSMEAGIGAGIYRLDYDVFQNSGNGLLTDRRKRTFTGIDQAFLSIAYSFRLKKPANRNREGGGL